MDMVEIGAWYKAAEDAISLAFFAFFGGLVRSIYRPHSRKLSSFFVSILISVPIGMLAGRLSVEAGLTSTTGDCLAVTAGIVAHDIIETIFWVVDRLKTERENLFQFCVRKLFGEKKDEKP